MTTPAMNPPIAAPLPSNLNEVAIQNLHKGQLANAEHRYLRLLATHPTHPEALHHLGLLAFQLGIDEAAIDHHRRAIHLHPDDARYHLDLGNALHRHGDARDAAASYVQSLVLQPDFAEAYVNLGNVFLSAGDPVQATTMYQRALALDPAVSDARRQLGHSLHQEGKLELALLACNSACQSMPHDADSHALAGRVLREMGSLDPAIERFRRAQAISPNHPRAGFGEALVQLLQGDFARGWANYERRWSSIDHGTPTRPYPQPRWLGQTLTTGRLFLWPEQGVGDEIMFASLIPDVLQTNTPCTLACDIRLQPLLERSFPALHVVPDNPNSSPPDQTLAHLPIGSLPGLFRTSPDAFRSRPSPYLKPDTARRDQLRTRYLSSHPGQRLIGIAWFSNNERTGADRSIPLADLAPLFAIPNLCWVSLQYGPHHAIEQQIAAASAPILVDPAIDQLTDLDGFAAQVAAMDLVLTIDNTTAHLAGALAIPTFLALPFAPDWRWHIQTEQTLWYPTMRLLRQSRRCDWTAVITQAQQALTAL